MRLAKEKTLTLPRHLVPPLFLMVMNVYSVVSVTETAHLIAVWFCKCTIDIILLEDVFSYGARRVICNL